MSESFKKPRPNEMRLKPLKPKSNFKEEMVHNFERVNPKTHELEVDAPTLNFHSPPWMPGILGPNERSIMENNPGFFKESFFAKLDQDEDDEEACEQLYLPRPPKKATWCGVCELHYKDYYTHVNSHEHRTKFQQNSFLDTIISEAKMLQEECKNNMLNEANLVEISSKETFAPNNDSKSDSIPDAPDSQKEQMEIQYTKSAHKEMDIQYTKSTNNEMEIQYKKPSNKEMEIQYKKLSNKENYDPVSGDKNKRAVRRLNHLFYEDSKEQPSTGKESPVMGRKIQVQKVFEIPTSNQTGKMVGEKYPSGFEEDNENLRNWMFGQHGMKNPQNAVSTEVEKRESHNKRSLKRKHATSTESDQELLNSFKKVKITDDNPVQENQGVVQMPVGIVKRTWNYLMNAFSERLGNLKERLFNQFGKN